MGAHNNQVGLLCLGKGQDCVHGQTFRQPQFDGEIWTKLADPLPDGSKPVKFLAGIFLHKCGIKRYGFEDRVGCCIHSMQEIDNSPAFCRDSCRADGCVQGIIRKVGGHNNFGHKMVVCCINLCPAPD